MKAGGGKTHVILSGIIIYTSNWIKLFEYSK